MFAQESVMDIKKLKAEFEKLKYIEEKLEYLNFDEHLGCYVEKNNGMPVGLAAWVNGAFYGFNQAAKAQAVPEGFVEKTESNTHHYFKLKDWDEWTCIDGIKDAITSDHDINAIVEVECLEVIEINNKPCFALLAFGKRHGTEVKFFDTEEEAIETQEPDHD